ncbi:MAG: multidrug efflux SMR transporter [Planctomycetota bacterium]
MAKWCFLLLSILCEVLGTVCLKMASDEQVSSLKYYTAMVVFYVLCFAFLGQAMKDFSLGVLYATWSGVGVSLLALIGIFWFGDTVNTLKVVSFVLVVLGIIGLNLSGVPH